MQIETNSQLNTQTRLIPNKLNAKGAHNKFDQHLAKSNEIMQPTKGEGNHLRSDNYHTVEQNRKIPIASHRQSCSKKVSNHKKAQPFDLF